MTSLIPPAARSLTQRRALLVAAICVAAGALILSLIDVVFGRPLRRVHVTWAVADASQRQALERRFNLAEATPLDGNRWAYVPLDTTPATLRALVDTPEVSGTEGIDRRAARLSARGPLTERRGGWLPGHQTPARAAKLIAYLLVLLGAAAALVPRMQPQLTSLDAALTRARHDPRAAWWTTIEWLQRGIPEASAEAAGLFRIVFVSLVVLFVSREPFGASAIAALGDEQRRGLQSLVVPWLTQHAGGVDLLMPALVSFGVLSAAGVATRASYFAFAAAFTVWACIFTVRTEHHAVSALHLTVIGLVAAPWGHAWSVDAALRRWVGKQPGAAPSRRYGFGLWLPGFVLGVTFLAAAWSKVENGPQWILNGTVRYHFVTDLNQALVSWGPALTREHWLAVALSAAAVVIEAVVIAGSFTRSSRVRLALGAAAASLLVGFALFQGLFWRAWWILLLSFVPWSYVSAGARGTSRAAPSASRAQVAVIIALAVQQLVVSASKLEWPPLASAYDMYSATYNSEDDYEASTNLVYQVVVRDAAGERDVAGCTVDDRSAERVRRASDSAEIARAMSAALERCDGLGLGDASIVLRGDRRVYDWDARRFGWRRGVDRIGPLPTNTRP